MMVLGFQKIICLVYLNVYRVDKSRSREQGGTGLVLLLLSIIEAHKQNINVRSMRCRNNLLFTLRKFK